MESGLEVLAAAQSSVCENPRFQPPPALLKIEQMTFTTSGLPVIWAQSRHRFELRAVPCKVAQFRLFVRTNGRLISPRTSVE